MVTWILAIAGIVLLVGSAVYMAVLGPTWIGLVLGLLGVAGILVRFRPRFANDPIARDRRLVYIQIILVVAVGYGIFGTFCLRTDAPLRNFGAGGLLAAAAFVSGGLLGLLFAIPPGVEADAIDGIRFLRTNSSLQQVSDWLTKLLLGATLTQVTKVPSALRSFGERYGSQVGGEGVAVFLLVHFLISGFLSGYLFTRIVLQHVFFRADARPSGESAIPVGQPQAIPIRPPSPGSPPGAHAQATPSPVPDRDPQGPGSAPSSTAAGETPPHQATSSQQGTS